MPKDFTRPENPWLNPIWEESYQSWLKHFPAPEFEYRIWLGEEMWLLMNTTFPHPAETYHSGGLIFKLDLIRALLLYLFGGIYADMDYV
jgi:mannosyltransferase OCH1-like enzyme